MVNTKKPIEVLSSMLVVAMLFELFTSMSFLNIGNVKAQSQTVLLISDDRFFADADMDIPAIQTFLEQQPGVLKLHKVKIGDETQSTATVIMANVEYHNISPRVLLTLLEFKSGILSMLEPSEMQLQYPMGRIDPGLAGVSLQVDWAARELVRGFNEEYLKPLQFTDGISIALPDDVNRASYAVYRLLSLDATYGEWQALTTAKATSGFTEMYQQYWAIAPTYTAPTTLNAASGVSGYNPFLIEPFHGPHSINSYFDHEYPDYSTNGSTVIFTGQRGSYSYDGHDAIDYGLNYENVYASAAGTVTFAGGSTNYCWVTGKNETALVVTIQHSNGHKTSYWHLNRIDVSVGQSVSQDQQIAQSGSTGCSTGPHLHFSVRRNVGGTYRNTDPYGWDGNYTEPCTQNFTCAASDYLFFRPDTTPPTTSSALSGTVGENGWYKSDVQVTLSAVDNSGGSGVSQTQYKIDSGTWQTYSVPFPVSTDGSHTVYYKSVDVAGNMEIEKSTPINIDSVAPTGSLVIQNGSAETYSTTVELNTQGNDSTSGIVVARFRDAGQVTWSIWYAPNFTLWQLIGSHGQTASVEAQFKDYAGNVSVVYSDTIVINLYPARPSSSHYLLQSSTFGAAGMQVNSSQYILNGTAGQPTIIGHMESSNYKLDSGYWAMIKTQDLIHPSVTSITRVNSNPTSAPSVTFTVTFSEPVAGVDSTDFSLTTTGDISGASVTGVTGGPTDYTIVVNTGSGPGTIRLDVVDDDTIADLVDHPLGGIGMGNGNFAGGEAYNMARSYLYLPLVIWLELSVPVNDT